MKILIFAQAALGVTLKEIFTYTFSDQLQNHGCHCARLAGNKDTAADSPTASTTDGQCRDWQKARNCAKYADACLHYGSDYDRSLTCDAQANTCAKLVCNVDEAFLNRITGSMATVDYSSDPTCSFDKRAPRSHDGEACCLNDQFEAEFYNFAEKSCNNGQVSSEPSPIFPEDLVEVAAMLDSIPDLTFDHTDTWLGPEIDSGLQDLNGDFSNVTEINSPTQPQRRKRSTLPTNFDLRNDAACGSLTRTVRSQGACGSCYAFAVASTTTQALCTVCYF